MKKIFALLLAVLMTAGILVSCGDKDKTDSTAPVDGNASAVTETVSYEVVDPVALGDTLTAEIEGDWMVQGIFQQAKVSDMSGEEALTQEQSKAVHIGSDFFEFYDSRVDVPYYKFTRATAQQLALDGVFSDNIQNFFPDGVDCLEVYEENGEDICATFYIYGEKLVYFGAGGYMFTCTKTSAVG